ncbi:MAG: hypothetical protein P8Y53_10875 [Pseudolabrys sp.]
MNVTDILRQWTRQAGESRTAQAYSIQLPLHQAAQVHALAEMFPGRNEAQIITDLLSAALDELEAALPYEPGQRIIAEDEFGDPMYEDVGPTPRFQELTRKHLQRLAAELRGAGAKTQN